MGQSRSQVTPKETLASLLPMYLADAGWSERQLAQRADIPRGTIRNWCKGAVTRPRHWKPLLQAAAALQLDIEETNRLLRAAGHSSLLELQDGKATEAERLLLSAWLASKDAAAFQAIPDLPYFVGRKEEMAALKKHLLQAYHPTIYVLAGMAGVGKTTLAAHLAYEVRDYFTDGVLWARVDTSDTMTILKLLADAYGRDVSDYADLHSRSQAVRTILAHKRALLVIDNAENSRQIQHLLPPNGPCATLVTTRQVNLRVTRGSPLFRLKPFDQKANDSAALFDKLLDDQTTRTSRKALADIADLLGHLPLALAIVAGHIAFEPHATPEKYLAQLQAEKAKLDALTDEEQSVQTSFNASYAALTPALQQFFMALGMFDGSFSVAAAAAAAGLSIEEGQRNLVRLYNLSLAQASHDERYQLHPLLREYAKAKLVDGAAYRRVVVYFAEYVQANKVDFHALEREMDNILAALDMAYTHGLEETAVALTIDLAYFLRSEGLKETAVVQLQRAHTVVQNAHDQGSQALILCALGHLEKDHSWEQAQTRFAHGLALAYASEDEEIIATVLKEAGQFYHLRGDFQQAEIYWRSSLELARQTQHTDLLGYLLNNLAAIALGHDGDYQEAEKLLLEGLSLQRELENWPALTLQLMNLSMIAFSLGEYDRSEAYLRASETVVDRNGYQWISSLLTRRQAALLVARQGDYEQAQRVLQQGVKTARDLQQTAALSYVLIGLGKMTAYLGRYNEAVVYLREGLKLAEEARRQDIETEALCCLGLVAGRQSHHEDAERYFIKALTLARSQSDVWYLCEVLATFGDCLLGRKKIDAAQPLFEELLQISRQSELAEMTAVALFGLAQIAWARGETVEAERLGQESQTAFAAIGHHKTNLVEGWLNSF